MLTWIFHFFLYSFISITKRFNNFFYKRREKNNFRTSQIDICPTIKTVYYYFAFTGTFFFVLFPSRVHIVSAINLWNHAEKLSRVAIVIVYRGAVHVCRTNVKKTFFFVNVWKFLVFAFYSVCWFRCKHFVCKSMRFFWLKFIWLWVDNLWRCALIYKTNKTVHNFVIIISHFECTIL